MFHWHAACTGCDFTQQKSGLHGVGIKTFLQCLDTLRSLISSDETLSDICATRFSFAKLLHEHKQSTLTIDDIVEHLV